MSFHRSNNISKPCSLLRLTLIFSSCVMSAMSMSYYSLDMRNPKKCVVVNYPGINLDVMWEVFDPNKDRLDSGVRMPDSSLNQGPIQIEIFPPDESEIPRTSSNHVTKRVTDLEGKINYSIDGAGQAGIIHICTQIEELPGRKYPRPTLVGLRIKESVDYEKSGRLAMEQAKENEKGQVAARKHFSDMERVLMNMISETNVLLKNADMIKDEEAAFHKKSLEMNSASRWWPMLHVIVLLVTGFTQANNVIRFFKSAHII